MKTWPVLVRAGRNRRIHWHGTYHEAVVHAEAFTRWAWAAAQPAYAIVSSFGGHKGVNVLRPEE